MKNLILSEIKFYKNQPIFYVAAIVFVLFCPFLFFINQQFFIAGIGSTDMHHFFATIPYICILILPALALHSYDFLDPLPFSSSEIVISKLIAAITAFGIMLLPLIIVPICVSLFGDIQIGLIIISFICILLYALAALSVCFFIFCAVKNITLSYIICALLLATVNSLHFLPLYFHFPDFFINVIRNISFAWHFDAAGKGILDTRDIFFYVIVTCLFIFLNIFILEKKKGKNIFHTQNKYQSVAVCLLFLTLCLALFDSSKYYVRYDLTSSKQFTVSKFTKNLTTGIESPLRITYYRSSELTRLYPTVRDVSDYLVEYTARKNIVYKIKDPSKMKNSKDLENYGIMSQQLKTASSNKTEYIDVYSAILIEYLDKYEIIPFVLSTEMLEYDIDSRVQHLINNVTRKAAILCGNGYSLSDDYSYVSPLLQSQGFVCQKLSLSAQSTDSKKNLSQQLSLLDKDTILVVIGSNKIKTEDAAAIENFIANGGKCFFAVSPYQINITGDWSVTRNKNDKIIPLISFWGITIENKLVCDISNKLITMYASNENGETTTKSHATQINYPYWLSILPQTYAHSGMTLYWASPLSLFADNKQVKIEPVLQTSPGAWIKSENKNSTSNLYETNPFLVKNSDAQTKTTYNVGAELSGSLPLFYNTGRSTPTKIMVVSDQYFLNTLMMGYTSGNTGDLRNLDFLVNALLKLRGDTELLSIRNRGQINNSLYKITDNNKFLQTERIILFITFLVVPLLFIIFAIAGIISRRHTNKYFEKEIKNKRIYDK